MRRGRLRALAVAGWNHTIEAATFIATCDAREEPRGLGGTVNVAPEVIAPKLEATMTAVRGK